MEPCEIRLAVLDDAEVLGRLNVHVQGPHNEALPWLFKPATPDLYGRDLVREILERPENRVWLATLKGTPAGYLQAEERRVPENPFALPTSFLYIHHIAVAPFARHAGVGAQLMQRALAFARERGLARVALDVWSFNLEARGFFRSQGFETVLERMWLGA